MLLNIEGVAYLTAGLLLGGLYKSRKRRLETLERDMIPEIDATDFQFLKEQLSIAYQRMFYLGVSFLYLAFITIFQRSLQAKVFGILLVVGLVIYNIPPRNRVMRLLNAAGIDLKTLNQRKIKL